MSGLLGKITGADEIRKELRERAEELLKAVKEHEKKVEDLAKAVRELRRTLERAVASLK